MKAIWQTQYGSPDILQLVDVPKPTPHDGEVLVKVQAASVHAGDWHLMRGTPFLIRLMFGGIFKPAINILGSDLAGQVEAVGKEVTQFQPGDEVFGDLSEFGWGAFAQYVCAPVDALQPKPANLTFEEAAAVPTSAMAALQALRDFGQIQSGQKVLINGASGGVGSFAVQIAKTYGAEVTAVCRTEKMEMVRSLNPDHIIDYTQPTITQTEQQYDLILDTAAYRSVLDYQPILSPGGTYVLVGGSTARFFQVMLLGSLLGKIMRQRVTALAMKVNSDDLSIVKEWLESGEIAPCIDRSYPLSEVPEAVRYLEQRQVRGKVVIRI
ncbi:NAD(P)-dependent alcohol dehydrogenase [Acaryochloris sp. IP29b_bin.137]|uniref:NAD(P)-dependent alcohol dehydrogenase n=1 Tax=Acaryochloris sp. IP29b_bin.137 TaxID=2969217 RepID=UPI002621B399|nr:NAD(P)-dependent alcohol dehydrogenase [Acaryochloris sp. IP29b_bin.137]